MHEKIADMLSDAILKEAGFSEVIQANKAVRKAKKMEAFAQKRKNLAQKHYDDYQQNIDAMIQAASKGSRINGRSLEHMTDYGKRSHSRLMNADDRITRTQLNLSDAKQNQMNELKNFFSINRLRGGEQSVV